MNIHEYGSASAPVVLIQPIGDHNADGIEAEYNLIKELSEVEFHLLAVTVDSWNGDLSPWTAPAVFGKEGFGDGAEAFLDTVLQLCMDPGKTYCIGGYSLARLFALWASCRMDVFRGVAAASPSVWFPGFTQYLKEQGMKSRAVYLSLGDREERTRNPVMATVGTCIRETQEICKQQGAECELEWNPGNHFQEPDVRMAKAWAWVLGKMLKMLGIH